LFLTVPRQGDFMTDSSWLEISLLLDGELAEAAAEVLGRFVSGGVVIEATAITADAFDEGQAIGPLRVCGYLPVDANLEDQRRKLEEALWYLGRIQPLPQAQFKLIEAKDWSEAWKENYRPISIGRCLSIVPAWLESPDAGRTAVKIDPGMAFGTGTHPTTQLCLEMLESWFRERGYLKDRSPVPLEVIDVGCGSGILAIAALKLGAQRALGVDIDEEAIAAARDNARLNGVADRLEVGLGSAVEIRSGKYSLSRGHIVFANILAPVIIRLLEEGLAKLVQPSGALILSGMLAEQAGQVECALVAHGLRVAERRQSGDWVALRVSQASLVSQRSSPPGGW